MIIESVRMLRLGVKSLLLHKLRSALTMLGLLFGVSSVVAMLAIGEGGSFEAQQQIKALGSTNILIRTVKPPERQDTGNSMRDAQVYGLTYEDADSLHAALQQSIDAVVPVRETSLHLRNGELSFPGVVLGTIPEFAGVVGMGIAEGRWLTTTDVERRANVAVLGATAAQRLFPTISPIGLDVSAQGDRFRIIGVLNYLGRVSGSFGPSLDEGVYVPITTSRNWFGDLNIKRGSGKFEVTRVELAEIILKVKDQDLVLDTARVAREMLADRHKEKDWVDKVPLELLRQAQAQQRIWSIVLASIAGISLLVGGIGIMNVMLATVTERTREIGIRRALGAKRRHIVSQFLVETLVLSACGGLLGVLLGPAIATLVEQEAHLKTIVHTGHQVMAFGVSAVVAIVFGLYPAWRAARMDPVEALRHE